MDLSISDKIKLVNNIYQDFLAQARGIEVKRDKKIAALFEGDDQREIQKILSSLKKQA